MARAMLPKTLFLTAVVMSLTAVSCADGSNGSASSASSPSDDNNGVTVRDFQTECTTSDECDVGLCVPFPDGVKRCTRFCDTQDCPDGMYCLPKNHEGGSYVCLMPDPAFECNSCRTDDECPGAMWCIGLQSDSQACLVDCTIQGLCPSGYVCQQSSSSSGKAAMVCIPQSGDCGCTSDKVGTTRVCYKKNEFGTCEGTQSCTSSGWTPCDAQIPSEEICDHVDNDCNGTVDDADPSKLNTTDHCGTCFNACPQPPNEYDMVKCQEGNCIMDRSSGRYDTNGDVTDGCECVDDTQGAIDLSSVSSMGNFTDCEDTFFTVNGLIPVVQSGRAHDDYYKFHYDNEWDISCWAYPALSLTVPDNSVTMNLCYGDGIDEGSWPCLQVNPGTTKSVSLTPPGNGDSVDYYFKVTASTEHAGCWTYTVSAYEE